METKPIEYVYVGRIIDHLNRFVDDYHKIGVSTKLMAREKQLSPTHYPHDVQLVRIFKTENMRRTEAILHTCFTDYRVKKTYNKKKKKTEWFYITEPEILDARIDKLVRNLPGVEEVDIEVAINADKDILKNDKKGMIDNHRKSRTRLQLIYKGENITKNTSTDTYLTTLGLIAEQSGWDKLMNNEVRITTTKTELWERNPSSSESQIKLYKKHWFLTGNNNEVKTKNLNKLIKKLDIKDIEVSILEYTPI